MAVKQKDIAKKLGVSIALVSRVLSGRAEEIGIAPDTIKRVLEAAHEMGYVPSAAALSLKGKDTRTIGVVVYDFKDPFFGAIVEQLLNQAHEHGYSLVLTGFIGRTAREQDLQPLYKHAIDGVIAVGTDPDARWPEDFNHLPMARIGHGSDGEQSVRVSVDEDDAARRLVGHLQNGRHRNIIHISCDLAAHPFRQSAFEKAASGLVQVRHCRSALASPFEAGKEQALQLLRENQEMDALVCANDLVAMGALHALVDAGVAVPGQVAVAGFDDIPSAAQFLPLLTTIRQPLEEMVRQAFRAVTEALSPQTILFPGKLVVRGTT